MVLVNDDFNLPENEIQISFILAQGPGGQNINKVSSAVQLRFNIPQSHTLDASVKLRLIKLAGKRVDSEGNLTIVAKRYRSQLKNRLDALNRLAALVRIALVEPRARKKTRPSVTASAARVDQKRKRGDQKRIRKYDPAEWE